MIVPADVPVELARLGRGASLEFPTQGMTSTVALFGDVVLKRCADPRYVDWLRREHDVLRALAETDLPLPRVRGYVDRDADVWLAIERLPGVTLEAALASASAGERERLLGELGELLARVHATPTPASLCDALPWRDRMLAQAERNLPWCDGDDALLAQLVAHPPPSVPEMTIHGDLGLDNVLVHDGRVATLLDWPMGGRGDFRFDVAIAIEHDDVAPFSHAELAAFWRGHGTPPLDVETMQWFRRLWDFF